MKKFFSLVVLMCLLGGEKTFADPHYYFSESSKVLNAEATSFNFMSNQLMSSGISTNSGSRQTVWDGCWVQFDENGRITYPVNGQNGFSNGNYGIWISDWAEWHIIDIEASKFSNTNGLQAGWTLRVNFDFAQDDWYGWFFVHQTTSEYWPIQNNLNKVDGWHEVTVNGNTFWSMYGYYEAVLTGDDVTYLKQNGINLRGKSITIQSVEVIPPATTFDASSFDWTAETYGEVEITNISGSNNVYTLSTSNPNLALNGKGGSIVIIATGKQGTAAEGHRAYYVVTVPYPDNHVWDFFTNPGITPRTDANWTDDYKSKAQNGTNSHKIRVATPNESATDGYNYINQTNAFYIPETAGLLFDVKSARLGYNNEGGKKLVTWGGYHITSNSSNNDGSHPKFIIPQVKGEKYIRIWWDAMAQGSGGGNFKVTNLLDLEGRLVSNQFAITGVTVSGQCMGCIIFKVNGSSSQRNDITIELEDQGWNDLYKIEICDDYETDMVLFQSQNNTTGWNTGGAVEYNNEYGSIVHKKGEKAVRYYGGTPGPSILNRGMTCDFTAEGFNGVTFTDKSNEINENAHYNYLYLTDIDGTGNIKVTQREKFGADNYVLNKKETWIAVGEYTEQTYPYTWDFMDWNMKQKQMLGVLDDSHTHGIAYGYWNRTADNVRSLETHEPVDATKGSNNFVWNNVKVDRPLFAQGAQLSYRDYDASEHIDINKPFKEAEGLRMKQYRDVELDDELGVELGVGPTYDGEISLDGNFLNYNPTVAGHKLVITIPNVPTKKNNEDMWLFVKSSVAPQSVYAATDKATPVSISASVPTKCNLENDVKAYKITSEGDVEILFTEATSISAIGVTHIFKSINALGYATESRDVDIDHEYEGVFTKNDVNAYCIQTYDDDGFTYEYKGLPEVKKSTRIHMVPKNTGIVLYADVNPNAGSQFNVPLFYPACNNAKLDMSESSAEYKAFRNNWMAPWVRDEYPHESEEVDRLDALQKFGTNGIEGYNYGTNNEKCTKFVMSSQYYVYHKTSNGGTYSDIQVSTDPTSGEQVEAFYRMNLNLANSGVSGTSNRMGANKAYLLIPTSKMPKALWNGGNGAGEPGQAKQNVIFMDLEELFGEDIPNIPTDIVSIESNDSINDNSNIYHTLSGMQIEGKPTVKGVYIKNGKKVFIK